MESKTAIRQNSPASTVASAQLSLAQKSKPFSLARLLPFLGPAFVASIAYVDPGNFATNIAAGSAYGYLLLWVIFSSNLMAMFIQALAAKLGIATGNNLAELCRLEFSTPVVRIMWVVMELVAVSTDLAEFLGAAIGFHLLFGLPLMAGGLITAVMTFGILIFERFGFRPLEIIIASLLGVIAACYCIETFFDKPEWLPILRSAISPRFRGNESVLLAAGILGATVMPHVIFLHSALMQGRIVVKEPRLQRRLFRFEIADVVIAMTIAGLVNMAMLIMASATFFRHGITTVASIDDAYKTLQPLLGPAAGVIFAVSLLASGLASSTVGTSAGQVIMQGFLKRHIPVWLRRSLTMLPSLAVIAIGLEPTRTLVLSQVVLSFGLPFAVVPLVIFTSKKRLMGTLVNRPLTTAIACCVTAVIVALNLFLIYQTVFKG
jgi:manganese transport protein